MFHELIQRVQGLNIPAGTFAIFGSGPMAIRGLKEPNDIDIVVTKETYEIFRSKDGWDEKTYNGREKHYLEKDGVELWNSWGPGDWDITQLISTAEMIDGLPYVTIDHVLAWKERNSRPKDMADITKIKEYLSSRQPGVFDT